MPRPEPAARRELLAPRYWPAWIGVAVWRAFARMPLPLVAATGTVLGELLYRLNGPRRRVTLANLSACFPRMADAERRRLARAHFHAFVAAALAIPVAWFGPARRLQRLVHFSGSEHLERVLAMKRPIILLAPHFVALDLGGLALAQRYVKQFANGYVTMYRGPKSRLFDHLVRKGRLRFGGRLVERREGIKPVLRELRQGTPLYYLPDQDAGRRGTVFAPFFGVPASTLTALSRIAEMTGAVIIPFYTRMLPRGRGFEAIFRPALDGFPSGDDLADATRLNAEVEAGVHMMREQYFWAHRRFKTRPEGAPTIYGD